jgi:hypothetical protein
MIFQKGVFKIGFKTFALERRFKSKKYLQIAGTDFVVFLKGG